MSKNLVYDILKHIYDIHPQVEVHQSKHQINICPFSRLKLTNERQIIHGLVDVIRSSFCDRIIAYKVYISPANWIQTNVKSIASGVTSVIHIVGTDGVDSCISPKPLNNIRSPMLEYGNLVHQLRNPFRRKVFDKEFLTQLVSCSML